MDKRKISYSEYRDKILGAWLGKSLGGLLGSPLESHKVWGDISEENCWPVKLYPNDDLDIQLVWLECMEELGPFFVHSDLADYWRDRCWYNFSEYGYFLYNEQRGIHPPVSGWFNNEFYKESMGCPIRSEIWGVVAPGNPELAAKLAWMDATLDHAENSVWAEQFWAAAEAEAFFCNDLNEVLNAGRQVIPENSGIDKISCEVRELWDVHKDLKAVWKKLIRKYGHRDVSKVQINFAFTILSLLAGNGDFKKTIIAAMNCAYDTDCTAATAGAMLGIMKGTAGLPADWVARNGKNVICEIAVRHNRASFEELSEDTVRAGIEMAYARNQLVEITDIPCGISESVLTALKNRSSEREASMWITYTDEPVLFSQKTTRVILHIHTQKAFSGRLHISSERSVTVNPFSFDIVNPAGNTIDLGLDFMLDKNTEILWDKNLFAAHLEKENGDAYTHTFGFGGARRWKAYGPYFDGWDTTRWEVCPYKNHNTVDKAHRVEGCFDEPRQNFVRMDKEYLDERRLRKEDIPEEDPFIVEAGNDIIDASMLGGFFGQACYYLVREVVSEENGDFVPLMGCTVPFVMWIDGEEIVRSDNGVAWSPIDFYFNPTVRFDGKPRRIVIKCVIKQDDMKLSLNFRKTTGYDGKHGISFITDTMGDKV